MSADPMPAGAHLAPQTYWEKRCELLEESVERLVMIIAVNMSHYAQADLGNHMREWERLRRQLDAQHPAPTPHAD